MSLAHCLSVQICILLYLLCHIGLPYRIECVAQQRFNPYSRALSWHRREPPLTGSANLLHKEWVKELWMEQPVDHFQTAAYSSDNRTWLMRYLRNDRYYRPNGPIFIFVGGEWEISSVYLLTGHMYDMARQHAGIMYYIEHRYYGQSWPTSDASTTNLQYLNSHQAMADLAYFIREIKATESTLHNAKVLLVGASYSGSLVAWFAERYPKLMNGGWASSAPLLIKKDFYEYMQQVSVVVARRGGATCQQRLQRGIAAMEHMLQSTNVTHLLQQLRICANFDSGKMLDRAALFNGIGNYFAAYAQSADEEIPNICAELMTLTGKDEIEGFIKFTRRIFWPTSATERQQDFCIDLSYEGMQSVFEEDDVQQLSGARQWFYQCCNEFGWFATTQHTKRQSEIWRNIATVAQNVGAKRLAQSTSSQQRATFGGQVPLGYFQRLCADVFAPMSVGNDASTGHEQTNASNLAAASASVILTYGQLDPWRAVGMPNDRNAPNVIDIADYSHTADLGSIDLHDSVEMNVAKLKVAAFLRRALRP